MVIALVLISTVCSIAGAILATSAGFGPVLGVVGYLAGGMIGTTGFALFCMANCALARRGPHKAAVAAPRQTSHLHGTFEKTRRRGAA